jgi:xanthine dehydrogenase small subunit
VIQEINRDKTMIDFLLNGQPRHCEASPDTSVLELLRESLGLTGTKEGCASGDCGACTVAIGEPDPSGELVYHSANACITPAHQLQGRALVTVEGLAQGEALHPAQAAMVECHGSQCGFCTPGIVMSLFTLHEAQQQAPSPLTPQCLEAALGGNLCRCTGYRPIRNAALSMHEHPHQRPVWLDAAASVTSRTRLAEDASFAQPITLAELNAIEETTLADGRVGWWVGAAVTLARLTPLLAEHYPAFEHLMHRFASSQIRNRATLGGNIANASPIGDTPPVLLALEARLRLDGPRGARELPLAEFFLDYKQTALAEDEFIASVFLPRPTAEQNLKVWKLSKRREDDISAVLAAFAWRLKDGVMRDVHLAFGGMAATPRRAAAAEAALEGQAPSSATFQAARRALSQDFQPMSDVRGSDHYRRLSAANLLERLRLVIEQAEIDSSREVMLHAYAY